MNILPILMIKNEQYWIRRVVEPLTRAYPHVIIGDTGSTDNTLSELEGLPNLHITQYGPQSEKALGSLREKLCETALSLGATHVHVVDGDHLYPTKYLRFILDNPMPESAVCGFHYGREVTEMPNGEIWFLEACFNVAAIFPATTKYIASYPFETNDAYHPEIPGWSYYWQAPDSSYCLYHLHHLCRSPLDADVPYRLQKQHQFAMVDNPDIKPVELFLKSSSDYVDIK